MALFLRGDKIFLLTIFGIIDEYGKVSLRPGLRFGTFCILIFLFVEIFDVIYLSGINPHLTKFGSTN